MHFPDDSQPVLNAADRRRSPRAETDEPVDLTWSGASSGYQSFRVLLKDQSLHGCCVESLLPVPERQQVLMHPPSSETRWGQVRYCRNSVSGYLSGIEFETETISTLDDALE